MHNALSNELNKSEEHVNILSRLLVNLDSSAYTSAKIQHFFSHTLLYNIDSTMQQLLDRSAKKKQIEILSVGFVEYLVGVYTEAKVSLGSDMNVEDRVVEESVIGVAVEDSVVADKLEETKEEL